MDIPFINKPLSLLLQLFAGWFGNSFAAAVAVFTLIINLILIPLTIKSQKSSVQQMRIKPKLDELKKKYGNDRQKMAQAQQKLYQDEGVSMSGGCLPMIFRLLIMMSIYFLILSPLTYMSGADKSDVDKLSAAISERVEYLEKNDKTTYNEIKDEVSWSGKGKNNQLAITKIIRNPELKDKIFDEASFKKVKQSYDRIVEKDNVKKINYDLFSIDLTETPSFSFDFSNFKPIWLIPIGAFLAQILTSFLSMLIQKKSNPDAPNMAVMMFTMPLITLWIGFVVPGGVGFYWICSSLIGGVLQSVIQVVYGPNVLLARERAKELSKQFDFEQKQIEKFNRQEPAEN